MRADSSCCWRSQGLYRKLIGTVEPERERGRKRETETGGRYQYKFEFERAI